jgi:hypothetical protein
VPAERNCQFSPCVTLNTCSTGVCKLFVVLGVFISVSIMVLNLWKAKTSSLRFVARLYFV